MAKSSKGAAFEREVCKQLSLWWTHGESDAVFWRSSGSGARATTRMKQNKKTPYEYGDVSFTDPIGKPFIDYFLVELKRGYSGGARLDNEQLSACLDCEDQKEKKIKKMLAKSRKAGGLDVLDFVDSNKKEPLLMHWWAKAEMECSEAGRKEPLIIFKRDGKQTGVMLDETGYFWQGNVVQTMETAPSFPYIRLRYGDCVPINFIILSFDDFLAIAIPDFFKNFQRTLK